MKSHGFSLIEILVGGAIASIISYAIVQTLSFTMRGNKQVIAAGEFNDLLNTVRLSLSDTNVCSCNFTPTTSPNNFTDTSASSYSLPLSALKLFNDTCSPVKTLVEKDKPFGTLQIKRIEVGNFSRVSDQKYFAKLWIEADKPKQTAGGSQYKKSIDIQFQTVTASNTVTLKSCQVEAGRDVSSTGSGNGSGSGGTDNSTTGEFFAVKTNQGGTTHSFCNNGPGPNPGWSGYSSSYSCQIPSGKRLILTQSSTEPMPASYNGTSSCIVSVGNMSLTINPGGFNTHDISFPGGTYISFSGNGSTGPTTCTFLGKIVPE